MQKLRQVFSGPWPAVIVGLLVALIGLILSVGGAWLAALGGAA